MGVLGFWKKGWQPDGSGLRCEVGKWAKGADGLRSDRKRVGGAGLKEVSAVSFIRTRGNWTDLAATRVWTEGRGKEAEQRRWGCWSIVPGDGGGQWEWNWAARLWADGETFHPLQPEGGRRDVPKGICYEALANLFCPEARGDKPGGINEVGGKVVCRAQGWTFNKKLE